MLRALSLYLPNWSVDLLKRRDRARAALSSPAHARGSRGEPVVLAQRSGPRPLVAACCAQAKRAGIAPGMTVAEARALVRTGGLRIESFEPGHDRAALFSLAAWAGRFSPCVAVTPPDGLFINITGCARLFRGEDRLVRRIARDVGALGLGWRLGVAPSYGAAWAIARFAGPRVCVLDGASLRSALLPLPVAALRVDHETVLALEEVGVRTVGDVLGLPRGTLQSRFGGTLGRRLDEALGVVHEAIEPVRPREPARVWRALDGPTTSLEALGRVVRELLSTLSHELALRGRGVRRLDATFGRTDVGPLTVSVSLGHPGREPGHLWSLLQPRMESMQMGFGIDRVELLAARTGRCGDVQACHWRQEENEPALRAIEEMCDALSNRMGGGRVLIARTRSSHLPERSFEMAARAPEAEHPAPSAAVARRRGARSSCPSPPHAAGHGGVPGDRPSLLLAGPEPARVIAGLHEGPPWRIAWRGGECEITLSVGPERIGEAWWDHADGPRPREQLARDYFKVQDTLGRWLWIYRERPGSRWYVHGVWA